MKIDAMSRASFNICSHNDLSVKVARWFDKNNFQTILWEFF